MILRPLRYIASTCGLLVFIAGMIIARVGIQLIADPYTRQDVMEFIGGVAEDMKRAMQKAE